MRVIQLLSAVVAAAAATTAVAVPEADVGLVNRDASTDLTGLAAPEDDLQDLAKRDCVGSAWHVTFWKDGCANKRNQIAQLCDPARYNKCQVANYDAGSVTFGAIRSSYKLSLYQDSKCKYLITHVAPGGCDDSIEPGSWLVWQ